MTDKCLSLINKANEISLEEKTFNDDIREILTIEGISF